MFFNGEGLLMSDSTMVPLLALSLPHDKDIKTSVQDKHSVFFLVIHSNLFIFIRFNTGT